MITLFSTYHLFWLFPLKYGYTEISKRTVNDFFAVAPNRTDCVTKLREVLLSLRDDDYSTYAEGEVTKACRVNDTVCEEQQKLFVDLVARKGDEFSQRLVVRHFLRNRNATEDHVHRCLFHCIALENPTMVITQVLLCLFSWCVVVVTLPI